MKRARSNAFTFLETMMAVALVAIAMGLASQLIHLTLRADRSLADAQSSAVKFDSAMSALRKDVWNAAKMRSTSVGEFAIEDIGAPPIRWSITPDGSLRREVAGVPMRTWELGHRLAFEVDGYVLHVSDTFEHTEGISFLSQRALIVGGGKL